MFKLKKVSPRRALACLLVMFALLTVFAAFAESNTEAVEAPAVEAPAAEAEAPAAEAPAVEAAAQ